MIRVVLVDDETLVKVGLKSLADWEKLGFEIVAEGSNGEEGLALIREYKPQLLITDIVMPKMDGIEMMRRAKELNPSLQVIVLSSYDEFELVRKSMKYGAWDYILKLNISRESMNEILERVREVILSEEEKKAEPSVEHYDNWSTAAIRQVFLKSIIENTMPDRESIDAKLPMMDLKLNENRLQLGIIETNLYSLKDKYCDDHDIKQLDFMLTDILTEIGNEFFSSYFLKWSYGVYVMVFSADEQTCGEVLRDRTDAMSSTIIEMLKKYVNLQASIGISNVCNGYQKLPVAFEQASLAIRAMFYSGYGKVLHYDECSKYEVGDPIQFDLTEKLHRSITLSDTAGMNEIFSTVLKDINIRRIEKSSIYELCSQISCLCDIHLGEQWHSYKKKNGEANHKIDAVYTMRTISDISAWLENYRNGIVRCMNERNRDEKHVMIVRAKKYIEENCVGNITLRSVAQHLRISAGYLSGLFPKYTGMCFTEYVNAAKVEKAQQLIRQGQHKIYEISYMLGYDNACYFSKIFKKISGCTPTEYQLNHTDENSYIKL